jgi:Pheromone A receptor
VLSGIDIAATMPYNLWYFTAFIIGIASWPGWKFLHDTLSQVAHSSTAQVRDNPKILYQLEINRWILCLMELFSLFGVSAEAREHYISAWICWQTGFSESSGYVLESSSNPFFFLPTN